MEKGEEVKVPEGWFVKIEKELEALKELSDKIEKHLESKEIREDD